MVDLIKELEKLSVALEGSVVSGRLEELAAVPAMELDAIPIEQLKGDIARMGHPIERTIALDPQARRLFFTDKGGNSMFAEYSGHDEGYKVMRVGMQQEIVKDYDPVDLEPEPRDKVKTEHDEDEWGKRDVPGFVPMRDGHRETTDDVGDKRGFGPRADKALAEIQKFLAKV